MVFWRKFHLHRLGKVISLFFPFYLDALTTFHLVTLGVELQAIYFEAILKKKKRKKKLEKLRYHKSAKSSIFLDGLTYTLIFHVICSP